jgi:hypothetical protein
MTTSDRRRSSLSLRPIESIGHERTLESPTFPTSPRLVYWLLRMQQPSNVTVEVTFEVPQQPLRLNYLQYISEGLPQVKTRLFRF